MQNIPLEILLRIVSRDYHVWRGMLVVRSFAEYTTTSECRKYVRETFCRSKISEDGKCTETYLDEHLHSFFDLPARVCATIKSKKHSSSENNSSVKRSETRSFYWYRAGKKHRGRDHPAKINTDGYSTWYQDGKKHRDGNSPAKIKSDGSFYWYQKGLLHREFNLPAVVMCDGSSFWYRFGVQFPDPVENTEKDRTVL